MLTELAIIVALTLVNGLLAMSEMAVVSSRPARLRSLQRQGNAGAAMALRLAESPGRFLSTVQIGITLVGVLAGAFSGATLGVRLAAWLEVQGVASGTADALGVGAVVVGITYLSLVVGELVPKQIALRNPEAVASRVAPAMNLLSRIAYPLVWLLDVSGKALLGLLGQSGKVERRVTDEEIRALVAEAERTGVIESEERDMIAGVMRLADRTAEAMMTPRRDVETLDITADLEAIREQVRSTRRNRLPVRNGETDEILGVVLVRDVLDALTASKKPDLRALVQKAPVVIDRARALDVLEALRSSTVHVALVFDEYGHFEGVISSGDLLEAIAGEFREEGDREPACVEREDGSYLVSGWMPIDEFAERVGVPVESSAGYRTVAGFVLDTLNHLPDPGESFVAGGFRLEVVDLDGRRIDKVLVTPQH